MAGRRCSRSRAGTVHVGALLVAFICVALLLLLGCAIADGEGSHNASGGRDNNGKGDGNDNGNGEEHSGRGNGKGGDNGDGKDKGNGKGDNNGNGHGIGNGGGQAQKKGLRVGFYQESCPSAESVIRDIVAKHFESDPTISAGLLRMHFHDCFVRGCDASVLIENTGSNQTEKTALPNLTVRGYEVIYEAKDALDKVCPSTVSCADIISLATRDSVALAGGPSYSLPTGRRDGTISLASEVNLPSPRISIRDATALFGKFGLTRREMIVLLGAHTVGHAHCTFFSDRMYNFQGTGAPDPSMNSTLMEKLKKVCPPPSSTAPTAEFLRTDPTADLDQNTGTAFDVSFYQQVMQSKGVIQFDQRVAFDGATKAMVQQLAQSPNDFAASFAKAIVKMGSIGVLTGSDGQIRTDCRFVNS